MRVLHLIKQNLKPVLHIPRINTEPKMVEFGLIFQQKRGFSALPRKFKEDDSILPVLIVGAGPVGLTLSILLTKLGKTPLKPPLILLSYFCSMFFVG